MTDTYREQPDLEKQYSTHDSNANGTTIHEGSNDINEYKGYDGEDTKHNNDLHNDVSRIYTSGDNQEYIMIGRTKVLKSELVNAFGGSLQPGIYAPSTHKFANPAPLGLSAFALTTFVLSMYNARAMGVTTSNVVVGPAMFYGGLVQLIAGIFELCLENVFGGLALSSYGGFWMSFAALNIPWFGVQQAYEGHEQQLADAIGFFLLGWAIFTAMLCVCTLKSTVAFFSLFFFLTLTFLLLSIGEFTGKVGVVRAGGVFGVITAFIASYNAFAGLATKQNSYVTVHGIPLPGSDAYKLKHS